MDELKKTALVLAGGGLTGAGYEIGALRAINDLLIDRTVNDFDIFVGTSAGALVGAMLANGITPEDMMQAVAGSHPELLPIERKHIFNIKRSELLQRGLALPKKVTRSWWRFLRSSDMTFFDLAWSLLDVLPAGFYDGMALDRYVRETLRQRGKCNCFTELEKDLFIVATDLDSGDRAVFSRETPDVPVSLAVAASSAIPLVYRPVRIGECEYVDGGLRGNASLDIAIEAGATLIVCINPMVPFDNRDHHSIPERILMGSRGARYLSESGMNFIANQVTRILTHASIRYHVKQLRRTHPEVDIILIEPRPDDYEMFFYNPMRYSARLEIARYGFESATVGLAEEYALYKATLARHGIPITRRLVIQELAALEEVEDGEARREVLRRILEARKVTYQHREGNPLWQLQRTLTELEYLLADSSGSE
ncbi:MAG: patatin family protein [Anaerolineae bacterium]|nr:MAG: patatin family protein [Anaerolineae bacterium]